MNKDFIIGSIKKMFNEKMIESYVVTGERNDDKFPMSWEYFFEGTRLTNTGSNLFHKIVDNILESENINRSVSREEINSYLRSILSELLKIEKHILLKYIIKEANSIEKNLISLRENVEVICPIMNLKLKRRSLQIGNLKIFKFSDYHLKKELKFLKQLVIDISPYKSSSNEIKAWMENPKKDFKKYYNKVCVKVALNNSPKKNYDDAIKQIEISLACLKLFSNDFHIDTNSQFGLVGSFIKAYTLDCMIKCKDIRRCKTAGGFVGYVNSFYIDEEFINKANNDGLRILDRILKKSERNEIEKRILNSISWYAKSYDVSLVEYQKSKKNYIKDGQLNILSHEIGEKFLKLVICLESLLLFREFNENKKEYLKQRSSFLLFCAKKDEKRIQKFIEESYNIRNKIVHEGYVDLTYSQLIQLDFYVKKMIKNLIKNYKRWNINSNIDLYKWFEKKRLSSI